MRKLRELLHDRTAYIVNCYPGEEDIKLACELNIPIYTGDPRMNASINKVSKSMEFFQMIGLLTLPCTKLIERHESLLTEFSKLILSNIDTD
jgi:hypothetical protein